MEIIESVLFLLSYFHFGKLGQFFIKVISLGKIDLDKKSITAGIVGFLVLSLLVILILYMLKLFVFK